MGNIRQAPHNLQHITNILLPGVIGKIIKKRQRLDRNRSVMLRELPKLPAKIMFSSIANRIDFTYIHTCRLCQDSIHGVKRYCNICRKLGSDYYDEAPKLNVERIQLKSLGVEKQVANVVNVKNFKIKMDTDVAMKYLFTMTPELSKGAILSPLYGSSSLIHCPTCNGYAHRWKCYVLKVESNRLYFCYFNRATNNWVIGTKRLQKPLDEDIVPATPTWFIRRCVDFQRNL